MIVIRIRLLHCSMDGRPPDSCPIKTGRGQNEPAEKRANALFYVLAGRESRAGYGGITPSRLHSFISSGRELSPPAPGLTEMDHQALTAEAALDELLNAPTPARAPTMGRLEKVRYTHQDMIDYIIANPCVSQNDLAARYGYSVGWVSNIMASDAWQVQMAARRDEIVDPQLKASIEERFRGVTILSLKRLQEKLEAPTVSDNVVLRAAEMGAKAMGVGGNAAPQPPPIDHLAQLAKRLIELQAGVRQGITIEGSATEVR